MVKRIDLYNHCVKLMKSNENSDSEFDTLCIFQDILNDKIPLFKPDETVSDSESENILEYVRRRCRGEPLQYILGEWEFWNYRFKVGRGVLIPRPDTETLIEEVLDICRKNRIQQPKILDLCSGSGCIAVTLSKEIPQSAVYAVEKSDEAFVYLEENIMLNDADVMAVKGDVLLESTADMFTDFDIIVSNPPYLTSKDMTELQPEVQAEPKTALFGGDDGLDFYRLITEIWKKSLKKHGFICYEYGAGQHNDVADILRLNNFCNIYLKKDMGGIFRTVSAQKMEEI